MNQAKKVMGFDTNNIEKDTTGGKIMKLGGYKAKDVPETVNKVSDKNSGFNGKSDSLPAAPQSK